jgi:beta-glucosidase
MPSAAARAVRAGSDLDCGTEYRSLIPALEQKLIAEAQIDASVRRLLTARFRLGVFDPPERVPYTRKFLTRWWIRRRIRRRRWKLHANRSSC